MKIETNHKIQLKKINI